MRLSSIFALSALATTLAAQRGPETEPNNTSGQAQVVTLGSQLDAALTAGDEDWFEFTTTGGNVALYAHGGVDTDTVFELFDATGTTLLAVNDDSDGFFSAMSLNLAAGTYQLRVTGWAPSTSGPYQLEFGEIATVAATGSETEPNDSLAQADPLAGGDVIDAALSSGSDEDWYEITLTAPRTGVWFEIGEGSTPWVSNHRWEIYDSVGTLLGPTATFGANNGNSSPTSIRSSQIRSWPAGTYYLVVRNSTFAIGLGNSIPQGDYRLRLVTMPMGTATFSETEPNNTIATANSLPLGGRVDGSITNNPGADPNDIYGPFAITTPVVLQFQTMQGTSGPLLDSTIRLLDENGTAVQTWTVGNTLSPSSHARATVAFSYSETYYIEVVSPGASASQAGTYALEIGQSAPPHVLSSYDIAEVNGLCLGSNFVRPTLSVDSPGERPVLGTNFSRTVGSLPANAPFFLIEGLSDEVALGTIPLPYDLGQNGAPDCFVHVSPAATALYLGTPSGEVEINTTMANSVVFRGIPIYEQAIVLDLPANTLGITSSNYARKLLGERHF